MKVGTMQTAIVARARQFSSSIEIAATADDIFLYLDDPRKLSSHMQRSSGMMAGSSMKIELDAKNGKTEGAEIILRGSMMGIPLFVREVILERKPPFKKVWQTIGEQRMIIFDHYKMGFEIVSHGATSNLTVFIEYSLPKLLSHRILGLLFGKIYARWCTERIAQDSAKHFRVSKLRTR